MRYWKFPTIVAVLAVAGWAAPAFSGEEHIHWLEKGFPLKLGDAVDDSKQSLLRTENGVAIALDTTGLKPGDAVTVWARVYNEPLKCSDGACGTDDIFIFGDGTRTGNKDGRDAVQASVLHVDGHVIDTDGKAMFRGRLPVGDTSRALFGPGLLDPMGAEIHLVVRTHQQAIPGQVDEMIYTVHGGCDAKWPNKPCKSIQYGMFSPPGMKMEMTTTGIFEGVGEIIAFVPEQSQVVVGHEEIKGFMKAMPMGMGYAVESEDLLRGLEIGDSVTFKIDADKKKIVAIEPAQ